MTAEGFQLDGNGIAGALGEIFTMDITSAERICQSCGTRAAIGAHRAYQGAGIALRCPHCGDVAALVGTMGDRGHVLELRGRWVLGRSA
jgi:predicted RNA-binding Zn-ribbon protein involved in translation (DUF1610 family)